MNATPKCIALIKKYEGLSLVPYICPAGYLTIGWGHVVGPIEKIKFAKGITVAQAEELLKKDIEKCLGQLSKLIPLGYINQDQADAIVSFMFNVGNKAFETSTMRRLLLERKPNAASMQFDRWVYATDPKTKKKVKLQGLVNRRAAERRVFLGLSA